MSIALKYGLAITLVVVVWILFSHVLFPLDPKSKANLIAPLLFNLTAIVAIYLGIRKRKEQSGGVSFKEGLKTGMSISFVYALSACLFFLILLIALGPALLANEPTAPTKPIWQVALFAFAGMFFGSLILGLVYSTICSFFLAKRLSEADG
jgi:hypothetical protein